MPHDHDRALAAASADVTDDGPAAGRRAPTDRLPVQRRAAEAAPVAGASSSWAAVLDDPFGMHLAPRQVQRRAEGATADGVDVQEAAARGVAGAGGALPYLDTIQRSFGRHAVGDISAHTGGAAAAASEAIGARAYATGNAVAFAGAPDLHTAAHEAAHVVQQRAGVHLKGGVGETGDVYERHADQVADAVVAGRSAEALLDAHAGGGGGGEVIQRKEELFSKKAFADPAAYLKDQAGKNEVIEEPGSQGILGLPDSGAVEKLSTETGRAAFSKALAAKLKAAEKAKAEADREALAATTSATQIAAASRSKEHEDAIARMREMESAIMAVYDLASAAQFYRQHTLALSKIDALPKKVHSKGTGDGASYTFHKDAGLVTVEAAMFKSNGAAKATALNGPFGTGFVRGHHSIQNMKHRFIDHVHVNKDDDKHGIDIYDTDSKAAADKAEGHKATATRIDASLQGDDRKAIEAKVGEANDADVSTLEERIEAREKKKGDNAPKASASATGEVEAEPKTKAPSKPDVKGTVPDGQKSKGGSSSSSSSSGGSATPDDG